jgi:hypothetical protein
VTKQVDASLGGGGTFETASADGSTAFFTKAGHLYRFLASTAAVTDLTPGGEVLGVLGASADAGRVYYLTSSGLRLFSQGSSSQIAAGADAVNYPPASGAARVSADGRIIAFLSSASLTGYDNNGKSEVYRYDAAGNQLTCVSCDPTGERAEGPATIPAAIRNGEGPDATRVYKPRAMSADGSRVFFDTPDSLVVQDTDERPDVYQWEVQGAGSCQAAGGCISLISGGRVAGGSFADASADGSSVFFLTADSLVARDPAAIDLYVARVGGGFPELPLVAPCNGDECQGPAPAPEDPRPGTTGLEAVPNPPLKYVRERAKPGKRKGKKGKAKRGKGKKQVKGKKRGGGR